MFYLQYNDIDYSMKLLLFYMYNINKSHNEFHLT